MRYTCVLGFTILLCGQSEAQVNPIPNPGFDSITKWVSVDSGANNSVLNIATYNGNLYVDGQFWQVGYGVRLLSGNAHPAAK